MITVTCLLWHNEGPKEEGKHYYGADDVRYLKEVTDKYLTLPHDFCVITDKPELFKAEKGVRTAPLSDDERLGGDRSLVKLMVFDPEVWREVGHRLLVMDLDVVMTGNIDKTIDRDEDLVFWHNPCRVPWYIPEGKGAYRPYYNLSILLVNAGARPHVWNYFSSKLVPGGGLGADQVWIHFALGGLEAYWTEKDGIYRPARDDTPGSGITDDLPENACMVFFPGSEGKPWDAHMLEKYPWIKEHRP